MMRLKKYRHLIRLLLAIAVCLLVISPALSAELLQNTLTSMQQNEQWWDHFWKDTFDPTDISNNISIYTFSTAVRSILAICIIVWLFQYGQKMAETRGMAHHISTNMQFFLPVVLVVIFLSNQGQSSRLLAYGLRDVVNSWSNGVMSLNIAGHNVRDALSDQLVTQDSKNAIAQQARYCMQMPQPAVALPSPTPPDPDPEHPLTIEQNQAYAYLKCIQDLGNFAHQKQQEALTSNCSIIPGGICGFTKRVLALISDSIDNLLQSEQQRYIGSTTIPGVGNVSKKGWSDLLKDAALTTVYGPVLNATQWLWVTFLETSLWLSALFAPLFIASSLIPGRQSMFIAWLIGFLTIGLAKLAYIITIAVVSVQLSDQQVSPETDNTFALALGLFAPGVSLAVVTGGGIAAATSFRSQSSATISAVTNVISGGFSTFGYAFSRFSDKNR